jgi:methylmalonyl-CoA/ethylmalonyl-CoA epimerase
MLLNVSQIGQIALATHDVDRAEAFYGGKLGLRKLFRFGDLAFFDYAGVRLLIEKTREARRCTPAGRSISAAPISVLQ